MACNRSLRLLLAATIVASTGEAAAAALVPAMYILGDSLVDTGNNNFIPLSLAKANFPYNGIDFPQGATGRFCNGRTAMDILANLLGFSSYPPPFLTPSVRAGNNIIQGVNFGSAAAGILDATGFNYAARVPLNKQLDYLQNNVIPTLLNDYFAGNRQQLQTYLAHSIFSVTIGSNDYINNYLLPNSPFRNLSPASYQQLLVSSFRSQLQRLRSLGIRKVVLPAVGPLGCLPSQLALNPQTNGVCVPRVNQLVLDFNAAVQTMLEGLRSQYNDTYFLFADIYHAVDDLINNSAVSSSNGFRVTNVGCCGAGAFNGVTPCASFLGVNICPDRTAYVFWDPFHPTQAVNHILAQHVFSGGLDVVAPINVRQLAMI